MCDGSSTYVDDCFYCYACMLFFSQPSDAMEKAQKTAESSETDYPTYIPYLNSNASLYSSLARMADLLPSVPRRRRTVAKWRELDSQLDNVTTSLSQVQETLETNKDMLADGQTNILAAVNMIPTDECDLSGLETGQTNILTAVNMIPTDECDLSGLETGQTNILTAVNMIPTDECDLSGLETGQTNILTAVSMIPTDECDLSGLETGQTNILTAVSMIPTDECDLSGLETGQMNILTQLGNVETNILAEFVTINTKLDELETGQQEICDKIDALEVKIDMLIDQLDGCPAGSTLNNAQCFTFSGMAATFAAATSACAAMGGALATMTADNEAFLYSLADMAANDRAWIGLEFTMGSWTWQDGSPYGGFTDWPAAEPTNPNRACGEARASSSSTGAWNNRPCDNNRRYICQFDPDNV